jgi:hypothetical protein
MFRGNIRTSNNYLAYNAMSLTPAPVPLPAAAWLMLSALGAGLVNIASRRLKKAA